jgi:alkaline phosphatase D
MAEAISRRTVLAGALAGGGALALGRVPGAGAACDGPACPKTPQRARDRLVQGGAFRHGVASGHPTERAVTLWSRVDGIERSGRLDLEIARDPGFSDVVHSQRVRAAEVRDYVVRARVGEGLRPGEQYFYRFATRGADSPVGRFVTARPRDSREPVRIGFFSCQDYQAGTPPTPGSPRSPTST